MNSLAVLSVLSLLMVLVAIHALFLNLVCRRWGTTKVEEERVMEGDALIGVPNYEATLAVTIESPPDCVWPWLAQMGYQRGGLYSYDWLDRLFGYLDRPSANQILPDYQRLEAGDMIPIGRGFGFPVRAIVPNRTLLLAGEADEMKWTWEFRLDPLDGGRTRLISRNRALVSRALTVDLFMALLEPAAFIMTRRMLLGIKRRAERLAKGTAHRPSGHAYATASARSR